MSTRPNTTFPNLLEPIGDLGITSLGGNGAQFGDAAARFIRSTGDTTGQLTEAIFDTDPLDTRFRGDNDNNRTDFWRAA